jgi:hypothetical protein
MFMGELCPDCKTYTSNGAKYALFVSNEPIISSFVAFIDQFETLFNKIKLIFKLKSITCPKTPFISLS